MPDAAQRGAARDARRGGLNEEAKALQERVRSQSLRPERLRLAALLGDPAAVLATGAAPLEGGLSDRVEGLTFGASPEVIVRIGLTAAAAAVAPFGAAREDALELLATGEAWLACPCEAHALRAARAATAVWRGPTLVMGQAVAEDDEPEPSELAARAAATAVRSISAAPPYDRAEAVSATLLAAEAVGEDTVWTALRTVIPWALD